MSQLILFKVTKIAQYMATVEEYHEIKSIGRVFMKSHSTDFAEVFTGDIKTPVKYAK